MKKWAIWDKEFWRVHARGSRAGGDIAGRTRTANYISYTREAFRQRETPDRTAYFKIYENDVFRVTKKIDKNKWDGLQ